MSKSYPQIEDIIVSSTASISILVSIISAVSSYLKYGERKSLHQIAMGGWQALLNTIKHTLSLKRDLRPDPEEFALEIKTSYDRLFEISPPLEQQLITMIKAKVNKHAGPEYQIPSYLNGWSHTKVYREQDDSFEENSLPDNPA